MKKHLKISGIIIAIMIIGLLIISCDFFKEKECSHCGGTGKPCSYDGSCKVGNGCPNWSSITEEYRCGLCNGTGKLADW